METGPRDPYGNPLPMGQGTPGTSGSGGGGPPPGVDPTYWGNLPQSTKDGWGNYRPPEGTQASRQIYNPNGNPNGGGFTQLGNSPTPYSPSTPAPTTPDPGMPDPFAGMFGSGGSGGDYQGTPIAGASGLNFLQPGAAEQFFNNVGGRFTDPTKSETYANDVMGRFGGGNTPGVSNRADEAFQQFQSSVPADMSSYYTNAERRAQEGLDRTMAARGTYGSSAAADMSGEMLQNMEADRAKAEAGYGLSRAGLAGTLGSGADTSSRGQSQNTLNWTQGLGGIAGQSDTMGLNRLLGGMGAASAAQGAQTTRGQNMFNNELNMGNALSGVMGEGYGGAFANDKDLFGQWLAGLTGQGAEQQGQATYNAQQQRADTKDFFNMLGNGSKFYQGFGGGGGGTPASSPSLTYWQNPNGASDLSRVWGT